MFFGGALGGGGWRGGFFWLTVENTVEKNYDFNVTAARRHFRIKDFSYNCITLKCMFCVQI